MTRTPLAAIAFAFTLFAGCGEDERTGTVNEDVQPGDAFLLEAWADNWFAAYLGEALIVEDSVPITTEKSFNAERASFDGTYPLVINVVLKDFKEDDSGLEYIGTDRQQMGDGGFIAQITDTATGRVVGVSDASWRCLVVHEAPLDKGCVGAADPLAECTWRSEDEPAGWKSPDYDVSAWDAATVHSAEAVRPKDGYDAIDWDGAAQLIWGSDLEADNTILCRAVIEAP